MHCKPAAHCMLSLFTQAPPAGTLLGMHSPFIEPGTTRQIPEMQSVLIRQSSPFALLATHLSSWQRICVAEQSSFVTHSAHVLLVIIMLATEVPAPIGLHWSGMRHSTFCVQLAPISLSFSHLPSLTLQNDMFVLQSCEVTHSTHLLLVIIILAIEAPAPIGLHWSGMRHSEFVVQLAPSSLSCSQLPSLTLQNDTVGWQSREVTHITHLPVLLHFPDRHWLFFLQED